MKDEILIRYINKHCTATEEKEILEWLKEKDNRQRLFELEQIWGLKAEMRFSDKGRMDEAYRQLSRQLGLSGQIEKRVELQYLILVKSNKDENEKKS